MKLGNQLFDNPSDITQSPQPKNSVVKKLFQEDSEADTLFRSN
jgi:hypothetical protein